MFEDIRLHSTLILRASPSNGSVTLFEPDFFTGAQVQTVPNPRNESAENELHVVNDAFLDLGLEPTKLEEGLLVEVEEVAKKYADRADRSKIPARSLWTSNQSEGVPQGEK